MKKDSGNSRQKYASPSLKLLFFNEEDAVRTSGPLNALGWGDWGGFSEDRSNTFIGGNE